MSQVCLFRQLCTNRNRGNQAKLDWIKKLLISALAYVLIPAAKVLFRNGRLGTRLYL